MEGKGIINSERSNTYNLSPVQSRYYKSEKGRQYSQVLTRTICTQVLGSYTGYCNNSFFFVANCNYPVNQRKKIGLNYDLSYMI
jgi:hypothetical protein